jgi:hypothetical protein
MSGARRLDRWVGNYHHPVRPGGFGDTHSQGVVENDENRSRVAGSDRLAANRLPMVLPPPLLASHELAGQNATIRDPSHDLIRYIAK